MAKWYQHIDPTDKETFGKVTTLSYIDDEDPDMTLYYFDDGSKCNQVYISALDDFSAFGKTYVMAEIENSRNMWKFNKVEIVENKKSGSYKDKDGNDVYCDIPDPYMGTKVSGTGNVTPGIRYDALPPRKSIIPVEDTKEYMLSYINYAKENNIPLARMSKESSTSQKTDNLSSLYSSVIKSDKSTTLSKNTANKQNTITSENDNITISENILPELITPPPVVADMMNFINLDKFDNFDIMMNGKTFTMSASELSTLLNNKNNIVVDEYSESSETPEWKLVANMIDMSAKDECDIDIALSLTLPPVDVYSLIKKVYPDEMSKAFVRTIANSMDIKQLRQALAEGLSVYYDNGCSSSNETSTASE